MKRLATVLVVTIIAMVGFAVLSPTTGQDRTEERLSALETRVSVLEMAIAGDDARAEEPSQPSGGDYSFSGSGDKAVEGIALDAGLIICSATHDGSRNFIVELYGPGGEWELVINDIGPYEGDRTIEVERSGDQIINITADGLWTLDCHQP